MQDFYTIATSDGKFIYFDMGDIRYDDKLPRRSCILGKDQVNDMLAKATRLQQEEIVFSTDDISDAKKNRANPAYVWDDQDDEWLARMESDLEALKVRTFKVVKVTFTIV